MREAFATPSSRPFPMPLVRGTPMSSGLAADAVLGARVAKRMTSGRAVARRAPLGRARGRGEGSQWTSAPGTLRLVERCGASDPALPRLDRVAGPPRPVERMDDLGR